MSLCPTCSAEILGTDKFCRNCGTQIGATTGELVETSRFEQDKGEPAAAPGPQFQPTHPFYVPPSASYAVPAGTANMSRLILQSKVAWLTTILLL